MTSPLGVASARSWRLTMRMALAGALLLGAGIGLTAVDAQGRVDAANTAFDLTAEEIAQLEEADVTALGENSYRGWLVFASMATGADVPEFTVESGGGGSVSWRPDEIPIVYSNVYTVGGWQPRPLAGVTLAGLALLVGSLFIAAARWRPRHPLAGTP